MTMTSQFAVMKSSSNSFDLALFLLWSLVTAPSFVSISSLVLKLSQFSFIRDWPEIRKSEIPPSEFWPNLETRELDIPNLARMSLMKCYWMLKNVRVTAFTVSEFLRENQQERVGVEEGVKLPQIRVKCPRHLIINQLINPKF